jgi:hypothetical protein
MARGVFVFAVLLTQAFARQKPPDTPRAPQQQLPTAPSAQKFPQAQNPPAEPNRPRVLDRDAFTFTRYELTLNLTNPPGTLSAEGKVSLRNDSHRAQQHVILQISSTLSWQSVELNGKPAEYIVQEYTTDIDHTGAVNEAILNLPQPAAPGSTLEVAVHYRGTIPKNSTRLERIGAPRETALRTDWDEITAASAFVRGVGYVVWYPVAMEAVSISEPDYERSLGDWKERHANSAMKLDITVPSTTKLVTSAPATTVPSSDRAGTSKIEFNPVGYSVPSLAIATYQVASRTLGSDADSRAKANFTLFDLPGEENAANAYVNTASQVEPLIRDWFGPLTRSTTIAELPDAADAPFESGSALFTPLNTRDPKLLAVVLAHQLTHAALYSFRPWINEGAAHFAQALERERQDGRAAAVDYMQSRLPALITAESGQKKVAESEMNQSLINASTEAFYRVKAMYCFWMLRDIVGDAALQRVLAKYNSRDDRESSYFQRLLEAESQKRLDWFFNDWVYRDRGLPDLQISAVVPRETLPGAFVVAVTIENTGGAAAEVPITVRSQVAEARARLLVPAHAKATTRVQIGQYPSEVTVNDGSVPESNLENNRYAVPPPKQ